MSARLFAGRVQRYEVSSSATSTRDEAKMNRWCLSALVCAFAIVSVSSPPALAQPAQAAPPVIAKTPSPRALDLAKRMMIASGAERQVDLMIEAMIPAFMQTQSSGALPIETKEIIAETVREAMREDFTPKLIARMLPVYAEMFSEDELEAAVTFYESSAGKALVSRTPQMVARSTAASQELLPGLQVELLRRLCLKIQCDAKNRMSPT